MAESRTGKRNDGESGHRIEDHAAGFALEHVHAPGARADHDHDDLGSYGPLEENPIWIADHVNLTTVGIDIGSSGTQVIFSRVKMRRLGEELSSRYAVTSREQIYESPVSLTPYVDGNMIDQMVLGAIIDDAYAAANIEPDGVDTGAVILTGEALRRENASGIAHIIAQHGGDFVCAAAGHHMEAMLAAFGSGAARVSNDTGQRVLNIDIGGGTTKLAVLEHGRVVATAALHIGGRLQVVDSSRHLTRLEPGGRHLALLAGHDWELGRLASEEAFAAVAEWMAEALLLALGPNPSEAVRDLFLTDPLPQTGAIDAMLFSGGVAEYLYGRESRDFGDMGRLLGTALRRRIDSGAAPWTLLPAGACIRATALGASEYSMQLSGNTIHVSNPGALLPRRNLRVVRPDYDFPEIILVEDVAESITQHLQRFEMQEGRDDFALAFGWRGLPAYSRLAAFVDGVLMALPKALATRRPLFLILDGDLGRTVGRLLREDRGVANEVLVIDGVVLRDFDFVDLGRVRLPSGTVPVTVKSLLFNDMGEGAAFADDDHHHGDGHHHGSQHHHGSMGAHEHPHHDGHEHAH